MNIQYFLFIFFSFQLSNNITYSSNNFDETLKKEGEEENETMKLTKKEIMCAGPVARMSRCFSFGKFGSGYMITPVMIYELDYVNKQYDLIGIGPKSREKTVLEAVATLVEYGALKYDEYSEDIKFTVDDINKTNKIISLSEAMYVERQQKVLEEKNKLYAETATATDIPEEKPKKTRKKKNAS
jgi:hypothetical protein